MLCVAVGRPPIDYSTLQIGPAQTQSRRSFREEVIDPFIPDLPGADLLDDDDDEYSNDDARSRKKQKGGRFGGLKGLRALGGGSEAPIDVGALCEEAFLAVSASSMYGMATRASKVAVRRLLYVVQAMSGEMDTAMRMRASILQMSPPEAEAAEAAGSAYIDALDCKQFLKLVMHLPIRPDAAIEGHKRIVGSANLFASLNKGSIDGTLSDERLALVAKFHSGRKGEKWIREVFWGWVDRQGAGSVTYDEMLDGLIDVSEEGREKFHKLVLSKYMDLSEGGEGLYHAEAALAAVLAYEEKEAKEDDLLKGASAMLARDSMHQTFDMDDDDGGGGTGGAGAGAGAGGDGGSGVGALGVGGGGGGLGGMLGGGMGEIMAEGETADVEEGGEEDEDGILGQDMNTNMVRACIFLSVSIISPSCLACMACLLARQYVNVV